MNKVVHQRGSHEISLRSLCNDVVLEDYFVILQNRKQRHGSIKWYNFPTVFFTAIDGETCLEEGFRRVARWTKKVKISEYEVLLFPIHVPANKTRIDGPEPGAHWYLIAVFLREKLIRSFDSLGREYPKRLHQCLNYLEWEMSRIGLPIKKSEWTLKGNPCGLQLQTNAYDCGFFVCFYARCLTEGLNPAKVASPSSRDLRKSISGTLRRGRVGPFDDTLEIFKGDGLFPGLTTGLSEEELQRDLDGKMNGMVSVFRAMHLAEDPSTVGEDPSSPTYPFIEEVTMVVEEVEPQEMTIADPFGDIPDMYHAEAEETMGFVLVGNEAEAVEERVPSPVLSITAEVDLLEAVLGMEQEEDHNEETTLYPVNQVEVRESLTILEPEDLGGNEEGEGLELRGAEDPMVEGLPAIRDPPLSTQEQRQSLPSAGTTPVDSQARGQRKSRMKRRTMWVTLADGNRRRVNVKKLGLSLYKPYG